MIDSRFAPYGLFTLRVALGAMFVAHALLKYVVFTIPGFEGFLAKVGLPAVLAWPIFLAELLGGIAIVAGFYSRFVSAALLPVLLGALSIHAGNGWLFTATGGGWEYPAFLVVAAVTHVLSGDGAFAVRPAGWPALSPAPSPQAA
ncbi:MAG TPA: DoxX family protein [Beijerinckiaceae bacterium]|jgi:putative oxidoreductase